MVPKGAQKSDKNKKYIFEVISNSGDQPKVIGTIWWTGKIIDSDVPRFIKDLKKIKITDKTFSDGLKFFNLLPLHFRNGYVTLKRVK